MPIITSNISGYGSNSPIQISGSIVFANSQAAGSDTAFFVSGSSSARAVFGGTLVVSGALLVSGSTFLGDNNAEDNVQIRATTSLQGLTSIGTTATTGFLTVSGSSTSSTPTMIVREGVASPSGGAGIFDAQNSAGTSLFFVSGSGGVGIGTNSVLSPIKLYVSSSQTGASASALIIGQLFGSSINTYKCQNHLFQLADTTEAMRINATGVGIGTATFTAKLFVSGSSTASTPTMVIKEGVVSPTGGVGVFNVQNSAGTSLLFVSGSGRIGIGTTTPLAKLHIGAGSTGPAVTGSDVFISNAGTTNLAIRDSTNNVELMNYAYSGGGLIGTATSHSLGIRVGNDTKLTLDTSGNATLASGNLVIGTSGKGIDFSITADAAGKTAELFDDYEKGTWTPEFSSTSNGWTYFTKTGNYTKIGNIVHATFTIWIDTRTGTANNNLSLTGFPFVFNDVDVGSPIYSTSNLGGSAFLNPSASGTSSSLIYVVSTGAASIAGANIAPSGAVYCGSITYRT